VGVINIGVLACVLGTTTIKKGRQLIDEKSAPQRNYVYGSFSDPHFVPFSVSRCLSSRHGCVASAIAEFIVIF